MKSSSCSNQFWISVVSLVIFDMDPKPLVSRNNKFGEGAMMTINNLVSSSYQQATIELVINLDHRKTMHSQIVPAPTKEMIRNYIDSKTIDSLSYLAIFFDRQC